MLIRMIAPYVLSRRTEYSKIIVVDAINGKNIADSNKDISDELLESYNDQTENEELYFVVKDNAVAYPSDAFYEKEAKYIFIPNGITKIKDRAFESMTFSCVSLPDSIETIEKLAFHDCVELQNIYLPDSVETIEGYVFDGCELLESVRLPINLTKISEGLFHECSSLKQIVIPDSVDTIESYAFIGCEELEAINLPKDLKMIDDGTFERCAALKNIKLPDGLETISQFAFRGCDSLESISIPDSVIDIGESAFCDCFSLKSVKLPNDIPVIDSQTFMNCHSLEDIVIPDSVEMICEYAFINTANLKTINIPKELDSISGHPFGKSGVETLIFNHDLKTLSLIPESPVEYDLASNSKISKLVIDSSVKTITEYAFRFSGAQIKEIDYLGTKEQFDEFKKNNKELFKKLSKAKKINFLENTISGPKKELSR